MFYQLLFLPQFHVVHELRSYDSWAFGCKWLQCLLSGKWSGMLTPCQGWHLAMVYNSSAPQQPWGNNWVSLLFSLQSCWWLRVPWGSCPHALTLQLGQRVSQAEDMCEGFSSCSFYPSKSDHMGHVTSLLVSHFPGQKKKKQNPKQTKK